MDTKAFKTKSEIIEKKLPRVTGNNQYKSKTIIALDGGYSAIKGVSPNKLFIFPSYAKKAPEVLETIVKADKNDIQYRNDETGEVWLVGQTAEALMDQTDIESTTDTSLYTRLRYNSEIFKVLMSTGIALGLLGTGKADEIFLQTGLPAAYKDSDEKKIKKALVGHYKMSIKVGNNPWASFDFELPESNIDVMEQPQGTLCACIYDNGEISQEGTHILKSKGTVILDIGFGTEDIFSIRSGYKNNHQTYPDTGMRAVFDEVLKTIKKQTDAEEDFKIFELQSYLQSGKLSYFDSEEFETKEIEFGEFLQKANEKLCDKSIRRLMQEYNNLKDYEYLIVTGGTGESRFTQISDMLKGVKGLTVLPGNLNTPDLACSYSNVMGYYMVRHAKFVAEMRKLIKQ